MTFLDAVPGFTCGTHRVFVWDRGHNTMLGELTPLLAVRWNRIRDDISHAEIVVATHECCELLGDLETVFMEIEITRLDVPVWNGVITRLEYEYSDVRLFAEDILWVAKRRVLEVGYNNSWPNIQQVLDMMHILLAQQCYGAWGDLWNMLGNLHPIRNPAGFPEPRTTRVVNKFQVTIWEDFDKYAEDMGADYTVIGRDIFYWDNHLAWAVLPELDENHISQFPRIVEYGNSFATRAFVTNGRGWAGHAGNPDLTWADYGGGPVDFLITNAEEGEDANDPPTPEELESWQESAVHAIAASAPPPVSVVIPANTTLMPGAPWNVVDLIPGAWFPITVNRLCRTVSEWQRLNEVLVTESAPNGETVQFSAISAPKTRIDPVA